MEKFSEFVGRMEEMMTQATPPGGAPPVAPQGQGTSPPADPDSALLQQVQKLVGQMRNPQTAGMITKALQGVSGQQAQQQRPMNPPAAPAPVAGAAGV